MQIVTERKELVYQYKDCSVRYHELTTHEREAAYSRATEDGKVNYGSLFTEALCAGVDGWEGVVDEHDRPAPVRRDNIMRLPSDMRAELFGKVMGKPVPFPETDSEPT